MLRKICFAGALSLITLTSMEYPDIVAGPGDEMKKMPTLIGTKNPPEQSYWMDSLYSSIGLEQKGLDKTAWYIACKGYQYLLHKKQLRKTNLLTICDYSKSSTQKRFYVIDMEQHQLLYYTWVAHGRNSGSEYATAFSNKTDSYKSSLGFMVTAETYTGGNGYSLRLDGKETGFNNNVRNRDIVIHGSPYVSNERATAGMMMGRSFGCPALPDKNAAKIIDCIKGGSCFFAWYPDSYYTKTSRVINADFNWPVAAKIVSNYTDTSTSSKADSTMLRLGYVETIAR